MARVLVVDDDPQVRQLLRDVLRTRGFEVVAADDGAAVLETIKAKHPDALVLDLKMPRMSGIAALRELRRAGEELPVLVLTGVVEEDQVLEAFEEGADDYVTKPFAPRVLVARLQAVLRRGKPSPGEFVGEVTLDARTHHARIGEQLVPLSPTEYELLRVLMRGAGRVFSAEDLLAQVWGPAYAGEDDIVRANIYRLRQKLEPRPSAPRYILGRRGVGYFFAQTLEHSAS